MTRTPEFLRSAAATCCVSLILTSGCAFSHFRASTSNYLSDKQLQSLCCPVCPPKYCAHSEFFGYHDTCWSSWPEGWCNCPAPQSELSAAVESASHHALGQPPAAERRDARLDSDPDDDQPPPPDHRDANDPSPDPNEESRTRPTMALPRAMSRSEHIPLDRTGRRNSGIPHADATHEYSAVATRIPPVQSEQPQHAQLPPSRRLAPPGDPWVEYEREVRPASYRDNAQLEIPR